MKIFEKIHDLNICLGSINKENSIIGFIPTMGALHKGHLSLIEKAKSENDIVVCSIFVNPSQFNNKKDLENYPRSITNDIKLLNEANCDILFMPSISEIYPESKSQGTNNKPELNIFDFGMLDKVMEGKYRPGHFKGVADVVSKLFNIVKPRNAYFGQKDFQQLVIVKRLAEQLNFPVNIIGCPTVREADGLAMSSRNINLSPEERKDAVLISKTLFKVKGLSKQCSIDEVKRWAEKEMSTNKLMRLEYFEIVDPETLLPIGDWKGTGQNQALMAVFLGKVRLIDNIIF